MGSLNLQLRIASIYKSKKLLVAIVSFLAYLFFFSSSASAAGCGPTQTFKTTWKTDNAGSSNSTSITIPTTGGGYSYQVDWNNDTDFSDPDEATLNTGTITHDFGVSGTYTIAICGDFPRIYFNNAGDKLKILDITQWGDNQWAGLDYAFTGAANLTGSFTDTADTSNVISMYDAFLGASSFNGNVSDWDTSSVTDMEGVFSGASVFNRPLNNWDTSNVVNMNLMFEKATSFNQPLNNWDMGNAVFVEAMFRDASAFNQNINNWNTSNFTSTVGMFERATSFNQPLNNWDVSNVTYMEKMFRGANSFNQPLSSWDVSNVQEMKFMFASGVVGSSDCVDDDQFDGVGIDSAEQICESLGVPMSFNQDISAWDVSSVTDMTGMFGAGDYRYYEEYDNDTTDSFYYEEVVPVSGLTNAFNQDLSAWDITAIFGSSEYRAGLRSTFSATSLSIENYDSILTGWSAQSVLSDVYFISLGVQYCESEAQRQSLIDDFNWTITDGGSGCAIAPAPGGTLVDTGSNAFITSLMSLVLIGIAIKVSRKPRAQIYKVPGRR